MRTCTRSSLLLTLASIAGCGALSIEANALVQSGPQSEEIGRMLVEDLRLDMQFDFKLYRLTNESGGFVGYELKGNGSSITTPPTVLSAEVEFSFTSPDDSIVVKRKDVEIYSVKSGHGKEWVLRRNACVDPNDDCYAVIDRDLSEVVLNVVAPGGWALKDLETPTLAQMVYLYLTHGGPQPQAVGQQAVREAWQGCLRYAQATCGDGRIESFSYSCNPQRGEVSCSFTCGPPE